MSCEWERKRINSPSQNTVFNLKQSQFLKFVKIWRGGGGFPCLFKTVTFFLVAFLQKNPAKDIYKNDYSTPTHRYQIRYFQQNLFTKNKIVSLAMVILQKLFVSLFYLLVYVKS